MTPVAVATWNARCVFVVVVVTELGLIDWHNVLSASVTDVDVALLLHFLFFQLFQKSLVFILGNCFGLLYII